MSIQLVRPKIPLRQRPGLPNTVLFPRELREAIPDLATCIGRVLDLTAVDGSNPELGPPVSLRLLVQESGKLKGEFTVSVGLQVEAARALAAMLTQLADQAEA
jgi:hypothetical protein